MTLTAKEQNARRLLVEAIELVQAEINTAQTGKPIIDSIETLDWVRSSLQLLVDSIDAGTRIEAPGVGYVATDNWSYQSALRAKVVESEYAYKQLQ
jgi:hypothetical protein